MRQIFNGNQGTSPRRVRLHFEEVQTYRHGRACNCTSVIYKKISNSINLEKNRLPNCLDLPCIVKGSAILAF